MAGGLRRGFLEPLEPAFFCFFSRLHNMEPFLFCQSRWDPITFQHKKSLFSESIYYPAAFSYNSIMKKKPKINAEQHSEYTTVRIQDDPSVNNKLVWLPALLIAFTTFLVYLPALQNGFVNWDDNVYVYENINIQSIDLNFFKWIFTAEANPTWHPLTLLTIGIDYAVWGLNPLGYHLTNIVIHALNTFLVFLLTINLMKTVTHKKALSAAFITALLFGIHPVHVESVAWISERKDVLCALFFLLTILLYLRYASTETRRRRQVYYAFCLILFALALMSKPMAVTIPVVLLIIDYYPLRRFSLNPKAVLFEKTPFLILSLLSSMITIYAQQMGGALRPLDQYSFSMRLLVAVHSYLFYLIKMLVPIDLAPFYPYPHETEIFAFMYFFAAIILIAITLFCVKTSKKFYLTCWLFYIFTLIPAIGIVKVGDFAAADRYTYLPSLGPFLLIGLGVGTAFERYSGRSRKALIVFLFLLTALLLNKTVTQIALWKDSITLWSHEIRLFPNTADLAYNNRGSNYVKLGRYQEAISDYDMAVKINPKYPDAYYNRGKLCKELGDYQQAMKEYSIAIELNPKYVNAYNNRGNLYFELRDAPQAIRDYNTAIQLNPRNVDAYTNRGNMYNVMGDFQEAIANYSKAIGLNPRYTAAYSNRGFAYSNLKDQLRAVKDYSIAIELDPKNSIAYKLRGVSYGNMGNFRQASLDLRAALELNPRDTEAQHYLRLAQDKEK